MKRIKSLFWVCVLFFCLMPINSAFAADTFTISGTVIEISTFPNMIAINEGGVVTEVYGIKFGYMERQYGVVIEEGTEVSVEAFEIVCYDGTTRLKAAEITVGDVTIELGTTSSGRGRNRRN